MGKVHLAEEIGCNFMEKDYFEVGKTMRGKGLNIEEAVLQKQKVCRWECNFCDCVRNDE